MARDPNDLAQEVLDTIGDARPTDDQVFRVLEACNVPKIKNRDYILRDEHKADGVPTMTLGFLIPKRGRRVPGITKISEKFKTVCKLLCKWAYTDYGPVHCTSVVVNKDYAAARHRDPSDPHSLTFIKAVGEVTSGGEFLYWPHDTMVGDVKKLKEEDAKQLQPLQKFEVIKGHCAHEVRPFEGRRYSVVFFNSTGYKALFDPQYYTLKTELESLGFTVPTEDYTALMSKAYLKQEFMWSADERFELFVTKGFKGHQKGDGKGSSLAEAQNDKGTGKSTAKSKAKDPAESTPLENDVGLTPKKCKRKAKGDLTPEKERKPKCPRIKTESKANEASSSKAIKKPKCKMHLYWKGAKTTKLEATPEMREALKEWLITKHGNTPGYAGDRASALKSWSCNKSGKVSAKAISKYDDSPMWHALMFQFAHTRHFRNWLPRLTKVIRSQKKKAKQGNLGVSGSGPAAASSHAVPAAAPEGVTMAPTDRDKRIQCRKALKKFFQSAKGGGHTAGSANDKAMAAMKWGNAVISRRYKELLDRIEEQGHLPVVQQTFERYSAGL